VPHLVLLEVAAAGGVGGYRRGRRRRRIGGQGRRRDGRRRRGRRLRLLPADACAARRARRAPSRRAREKRRAFRIVGAARAEAETRGVAVRRARARAATAAPAGAVAVGHAPTEGPALARADPVDARRVEVPRGDAVRRAGAVRDARHVRRARAGNAAERWTRRLAMKALRAVRRHRAAVADHALVALAMVVPGAVRQPAMDAAPDDLARRVDAERAVRAILIRSARAQIRGWKALGGSRYRAPLASLHGRPQAPSGRRGQPCARGGDVAILTRRTALRRGVAACISGARKETCGEQQGKKRDPHDSDIGALAPFPEFRLYLPGRDL